MSVSVAPRPAVKPPAPPRRPSLGARLLAEHEQKCSRCLFVRLHGLRPKYLCGAGRVLAIADLRARARRRAS